MTGVEIWQWSAYCTSECLSNLECPRSESSSTAKSVLSLDSRFVVQSLSWWFLTWITDLKFAMPSCVVRSWEISSRWISRSSSQKSWKYFYYLAKFQLYFWTTSWFYKSGLRKWQSLSWWEVERKSEWWKLDRGQYSMASLNWVPSANLQMRQSTGNKV